MDWPASLVPRIKSGSQLTYHVAVAEDKTGTESTVSHVPMARTGTQSLDLVDVPTDKIGTEKNASPVLEEGNGTNQTVHVFALTLTGTDSLVLDVHPAKTGTKHLYHAHAHQDCSGTGSTVEAVQDKERGTIN